MGKLWDKIREVFLGKKPQMLPSGDSKTNYRQDKTAFKQQQRDYMKTPQVNNTYLEYALSQYFQEYLKQINDSQITGKAPNSYNVLVSINAMGENTTQNVNIEKHLLDKIDEEKRYNVFEQKDGNTGKCYFYHVKSNGYKDIKDKDIVRIYLNCREENVAKLVSQILEYNNNPNFYLKFDSTESMNEMKRSEKIVVYTDDEHLNQDIQTIRNVRMQHPELFRDSEKMNPFVQQFDDMYSIVRQVESENYMDLKGNRFELAKSTNTFIAQILEDSYKEAVQDIAKKDPRIGFLLEDTNKNNYNLYVQSYPYINAKYHNELINSMETNMKILAHNNNVVIKGISPNTLEQHEMQQRYNDNR